MREFDVSAIDIGPIHRLFRECRPRLLVVTDGSLNGGSGGFGLSRFLDTLQSTTIHGLTPTVVHRMRTTASADDAFDDLDISRFDVVFLFGINTTGNALGSASLERVKRFMQAGGGVFATGDHEDLGTGMSGAIPRVRAMRYWAATETPDAADSTRLTTNLYGQDRVFEFDDQADAHPQRLYANFAIPSDYPVLSPFPPVTSNVRHPHPLVRMADGSALDVYPDHPHEGECRIPEDYTTTFVVDGQTVAEWPRHRFFAFPQPRAVASTMSFGNGFDGKSPVAPRAFIAIAAYNGQAAGVGRVVTDATWHHYVNVNLDGMLVLGLPNGNLLRIQRYWANLANWLMPAKTRRCLWPWVILDVLRNHPLAEEIRIPVDTDLPVGALRDIGVALVSAGDRGLGGAGIDFVADVLASLVDPDAFDEPKEPLPIGPVVLDVAAAVIGSYVVDVVRSAAEGRLKHDDDAFVTTIRRLSPRVIKAVLGEQRKEMERVAQGLEVLSAALPASRVDDIAGVYGGAREFATTAD